MEKIKLINNSGVGKLIKLSKADLLAHSNLAIINKFSILENIEKEYYSILDNNEPYKLSITLLPFEFC